MDKTLQIWPLAPFFISVSHSSSRVQNYGIFNCIFRADFSV